MGKRINKPSSSQAERWNSSIQATYGTPSISLVKGKGIEVWDVDGKKYLDLLGGIATNLLGHSHPRISAAIAKQAKELSHVSNFYSHPQVLDLAERLVKISGDSSARVFFCNSGAEANEAALKLSRLTGRKRVVAAVGAFHGRTMGALSLTGQPGKRDPFKPLVPKVAHVPYGDVKALFRRVNRRTAMLIIEPIMGEAGVVVPPSGYLKAAREVCDKTGALLVIDCVQTGMGRTGNWFGFEHEGIKPDAITLAKGLGGGLPLGAMIAFGPSAELFTAGSHGTTFGGNPIACAAANVVISEIEKYNYISLNSTKGALLRNLLSPIEGVTGCRGRGLLIGIQVRNGRAKEIASKLANAGYLVNATSEDVIRIAPAFIITERQIIKFAGAFAEICEEIYDG
ncbi:MAG: acetylornithine transaminase [Candidatus Nanopelagicaceae bacterium]|nr:acetylornithine transaminase [Candidatus Nanopelagicaceae bacterium]